MFSAVKTIADWAMSHRFLAAMLAACAFLLSVSQSNRRGEYYFRTAAETRYLQELRQKYGTTTTRKFKFIVEPTE